MYRPFCHLAYQTPLLSVYKVPGMVEKLIDHIHRAHIKAFMCDPLGLLKSYFVNFSIFILALALILFNRIF